MALAVVASVICVLIPAMSSVPTPWFWLVCGGLVAMRWCFERAVAVGGAFPRVLFVVQALLAAGSVLLHPLYGVYAFTGYLDAPRVWRGAGQAVAFIVVACVLSFSQIGGLVGEWATPSIYVAFVALNLAIASTMALADRSRAAEQARRVETMRRLLEAERENTALHARLAEQAREAGVLEERARLSREIHDTVAQGLVAIVRQLDALDAEASAEQMWPRVERASASAREALGEARRAVAALASPRLDDDDLPTALDRLVTSWSAECRVVAEVVVDGPAREGVHDAALLRLAQEAMSNVARHGRASRAMVSLAYDEASVRLDVRDDGVGFDPAVVTGGHGLTGMRRRAAEIGGDLVVETGPGLGCAVTVEVPLDGSAGRE